MRRLLFVLSLLFLTACSADARPVISFIGIASGTLTTDLGSLQFRDRFAVGERDLVAVVGFQKIKQGTTVQATWFSPDDRRMPLGRTSIVTESGATITRFSFASAQDWTPAPYLLQVDAIAQNGDAQLIGTGSLSFFIGMKDEQIAAYQREFEAWKQADAAERAVWEEKEQAKNALLQSVQEQLSFDHASLLLQRDIIGDGSEEYVIADAEQQPGGPMGSVGVLLSASIQQMAIADGSGAILLSVVGKGRSRIVESKNATLIDDLPKTGDLHITILPSLTVSLSWKNDEEECFAELEPGSDGYVLGKRGCR